MRQILAVKGGVKDLSGLEGYKRLTDYDGIVS